MPQSPQLVLSLVRSTQALPHFASPSLQPAEHVPSLQTSPFAQAFPHVPQLRTLVWRSSQTCTVPPPPPPPPPNVSVQTVSPVGHVHAPSLHVPPFGHALPHDPQLLMLVSKSTHALPPPPNPPPVLHDVRPVAQPAVQTPLTHESSGEQRFPHAPQFVVLELVSTH